jgi:hypothetical protein
MVSQVRARRRRRKYRCEFLEEEACKVSRYFIILFFARLFSESNSFFLIIFAVFGLNKILKFVIQHLPIEIYKPQLETSQCGDLGG